MFCFITLYHSLYSCMTSLWWWQRRPKNVGEYWYMTENFIDVRLLVCYIVFKKKVISELKTLWVECAVQVRQIVEFRQVLLTQLGDTSNLWAGNLDWMVETKTEFFLISNFRRVPNIILSFGWFSGFWILCSDVSKHSVSSIFIGGVSRNSPFLHHLWRWNRQRVSKRRHIQFRRRGIAQKNEYNKTEFTAQHRQLMARLWIRQHFGTSKQITCNSDPSGPHNSEYTSLYVTLHHTTDAADISLSNRTRTYKKNICRML